MDTLVNEQVIIDSIPANTFHDGCRLIFLQDKTLLITTGDAGNTSLSQNRNSLAEKILRINRNGGIPTNNPNPNSPIYTAGHRNAQGLFLFKNNVFSSEHGPSTNDEINIIKPDRNYGWPNVEGFCNTTQEIQFCNDSNVVEPIFAWTPTVAASDIVVYDHPAIPEWSETILLTTLKNQNIISLQLNAANDSVVSTQNHFTNFWGRLRDICIGMRGEVYVISNGFSRNGNQGAHKIIKIENMNFVSLPEQKVDINNLTIHPNPVSNILFIEGLSDSKQSIKIFSADGKFKSDVTIENGKVDVANLQKGIYFIWIDDSSKAMKFIKY